MRPEDREIIRLAARRLGIRVSELLRRAAIAAALRVLTDDTPPDRAD